MGRGGESFLCPKCLDQVQEPSTDAKHGITLQRLSQGAAGIVGSGHKGNETKGGGSVVAGSAAGPDEVSLGSVAIEGLEEK